MYINKFYFPKNKITYNIIIKTLQELLPTTNNNADHNTVLLLYTVFTTCVEK